MFDDEFDRASTDVIHRPSGGHCGIAHGFAHGLRHAGCWCFFQYLLVTPLYRAIALEQVNVIAMAVTKHLNFNVARALNIFFDQHRVVAKAVFGFPLTRCQRSCKVLRLLDDPHALATAAGTGLDQHRVANLCRFVLQQASVLIGTVITRNQWHTSLFHQLLGGCLEPHGLNSRGRRPNKDQASFCTGLRKGVVLAQKSITRVNGLGAT